MSDAKVLGRFIWHELMTTDTEAAAAFYTKVIGWKIQDFPQDPSYRLFVAKAGPVAGLMLRPEEARQMGAPPAWSTYIGTPDVDETARKAEELGGRILRQPTDIPQVGRFAVLQDPQWAVFLLFTPSGDGMDETPPEIGGYSWHELITTDWKAALDFYSTLFGWQKTDSMDMGEMGTYQMYGREGRTLGGMFNKPKDMPAPPHWLPYIKVADARKVAETVQKLGGKVINGPMEVPGGDWIVQCQDLQGAVFAVHSAKPAEKEAAPAKRPAERRAAAKPAAGERVAAKPSGSASRKPAVRTAKTGKKAVARKAGKTAARKAAKKAAARKAAKKAAVRKTGKKAAVRKTGKKAAVRKTRGAARKTGKAAARKKAPARKAKATRKAGKAAARKAGRKAPSRKTGKKGAARKGARKGAKAGKSRR